MMLSKVICIFLLTLLFLSSFSNLPPLAHAVVTGSDFYEEITGLPFWARVADVNSKGHIFVLSLDDDVWRSTDNGASWTKVLDDGKNWNNVINFTTMNWLTLYIDSQDQIFTNIVGKTPPTFYRSLDNGASWQVIASPSRRSWRMDESSNGSLFRHDYSSHWAAIYKSNDGGATWSIVWNFTLIYGEGWGEDLRAFAIDDYDDSKVWAATPFWIKCYNGSAWLTMNYDPTGTTWPSAFWFDDKYVYMGQELKRLSWRYSRSPTPVSPVPKIGSDIYWDPGSLTYVNDEHSFEGLRVDDIMLFGIRSQLWGSWDGERWVKIVDLGDGATSNIGSISRRHPIYFTDKKQGKLYRLNIKGKEDLIRLFYTEFNSKRGVVNNAENYVLEQRLYNGTNYADLSSVALSNVQASIEGLSRNNELNTANAGFESGDKRGWRDVGSVSGTVVSEDKANGTYSVKYLKNATQLVYLRPDPVNYITVKRGELLRLSAYIKGNATVEDASALFLNGTILLGKFRLTTSWQRISAYYKPSTIPIPSGVKVYAVFYAYPGAAVTIYLDSLMAEKYEIGTAFNGGNNEDDFVFYESPFTFHSDIKNTTNALLTIADQTVSYSGPLTNGTESPTTNLTGILTGTVPIEARIQGSGQAILRLTGTRILYEDSVILEGRKDNVYYGRYYGAFEPTTSSGDLIAVANFQANIASLSYTTNKLTLTIASPSSSTSTTKVYVGDKGEPKNITGANSWSYNSTSKILTITAPHSSPTTIIVEWKLMGDINGDNTVNNQDLIILNQAFGSTGGPPPSPNWNVDADLNKDNNVNVLDLQSLGKNYGKVQG